ncbi:MAG: hypothetical protein LBN02_10440 [Oscillospiraceae bacterium]|jgi:hypothetical protein|nr:hypothetical protein [Oscillospiraceae bacterium]
MTFDIPDSRLAIFDDAGELYLAIRNSEYPELERHHIARLTLAVDNKRVTPDIAIADGVLTLTTRLGEVVFRFDRPDLLRVAGHGRVALRLHFEGLHQFENAAPREDGSLEVAFVVLGKVLIVPLAGALHHDAMWVPARAQSEDFTAELLPSVETLRFDAAIHEYFSNGVRDEEYAEG